MTRSAAVAVVKGVEDTFSALRTTVKNQTTKVLKDAGKIGSEAGATARKALLSAASLPRDVIEKAIEGSTRK